MIVQLWNTDTPVIVLHDADLDGKLMYIFSQLESGSSCI